MKTIQNVVLVNEQDVALGKMEKLEAHIKGELHRAFSVFIFNSDGELLLQKRADGKYHSGGLWTNTCCGHPNPGEVISSAVSKRLNEEMGMLCNLKFGFKFLYKENVGNHLTEHEVDHVFFGISDEAPELNDDEVSAYRYVSLAELQEEMSDDPYIFTKWFKLIYEKAFDFYSVTENALKISQQ